MSKKMRILLLLIILIPSFVFAISVYYLPYDNGTSQVLTRGYNDTTHIGKDVYALDFTMNGCDGWGTSVVSFGDGVVTRVETGHKHGEKESYGNQVLIEHPNNFVTRYAHLNKVTVKKGEKVLQGQEIGTQGNTGSVYGKACKEYPGTHLHFVLYKKSDSGVLRAYKPEPMSGYTDFTAETWYTSDNELYNPNKEIPNQPQDTSLNETNNTTPSFFSRLKSFFSNIFNVNDTVEGELQQPEQEVVAEVAGELDEIIPEINDAQFVPAQVEYTIPQREQEITIVVQAENTGNTTWTNQNVSTNVVGGDASYYHPSWITGLRPAMLDQNAVAPGEVGTFTQTITVASSADAQLFRLQLVLQQGNLFKQLGKGFFSANIFQEEPPEEIKEPVEPEVQPIPSEEVEKPVVAPTPVFQKVIDTIVDTVTDTVETIVDTVESVYTYTYSGGGGGGSSAPTQTTTPAPEVVAPEFTITYPETESLMINTSTVEIIGTKNEETTAIIVNDDNSLATYPSSTAWTAVLPLIEGKNTFVLYATDGTETSATTSFNITLDTELPTVPTVTAQQTGADPAGISASWSSDDAELYDAQMNTNAAGWSDITTSTISTSYEANAAILDTYKFRARSIDEAGNVSDWGYTATTTIDWSKTVVINEVAYAGAESKSNPNIRCSEYEWVELYNPGESDIDLSDWSVNVETDTASSSIALSGTLAAGAYFLVGNEVDGRSFRDISLDIAVTTNLPDTGAILQLRDGNDAIVDELSFASGWPAGEGTRPMKRVSAVTPGSLASSWGTAGGISPYGTYDACGTLYGSPGSINGSEYLLKDITSRYPDLMNENTIRLTSDHSPYVLASSGTTLPDTYTLQIDPGVVIIGQTPDAYLQIDGNLNIFGSSESPVVFTSARNIEYSSTTLPYFSFKGNIPVPGDWSRITITPSATANIDHAIISYGGKDFQVSAGQLFGSKYLSPVIRNQGKLYFTNSALIDSYINTQDSEYNASIFIEDSFTAIENAHFDSGYMAIQVAPNTTTGTLQITNSSLENYSSSIGVMDTRHVLPKLSLNTIQNNIEDAIHVSSMHIQKDTSFDHIKYSIGNVLVDTGVTLTLGPGTEFVLGTRSPFEVNGTLHTNGTVAEPAQIYGNSEWGALVLNNGSHTISHTNISGGGLESGNNPDMIRINDATVVFDTVQIMDSRRPATLIESNASSLRFNDSQIGWTSPLINPPRSWTMRGIYMNSGTLHLDNTTFSYMTVGVEGKKGPTITTANMITNHFTGITWQRWFPTDLIIL